MVGPGEIMLSMNFDVQKMRTTIQANRDKHAIDYEKMVADYKHKMTDVLNGKLAKLKAGDMVSPDIQILPPFNYLDEYDQALGMLSATTDTTIALDNDEWHRYMLDNWPSKNRFMNISNSYKR